MQIECKLHREGGTRITLGNTEYHFAPLADGAHVAAVADEEHQDRLLAISEAYKPYRGKEKPAEHKVDVDGDGDIDGADERATLATQYEAKFGKKPHHKWGADKIREELAGE